MMKKLFYLLLLSLLSLSMVHGAPDEKAIYYIQLIQGGDAEQPATPGSKPIGPKLNKQLQSIFRWKNYWEVSRKQVDLGAAKKIKTRLDKDREIEIDLTTDGKRKVVCYEHGKATSSMTNPVGEAMTVIGGDVDPKNVWFIIVRRDKPAEN